MRFTSTVEHVSEARAATALLLAGIDTSSHAEVHSSKEKQVGLRY